MATRTQVILISDLSGDEMQDGGESINFSYRGVDYSIDLTDKEAKGFDKAIAMYLEHAQRKGGRARPGISFRRRASGFGRTATLSATVAASRVS